jgi:hypothetical protein
LAPTVPEERVKISWVTIDRICQEEADGKEDVRRELVRNGRPLTCCGCAMPQRWGRGD